MARTKSVFVCQHCGYESPRWMGRCPGCDEWNTMTEELINKKAQRGGLSGRTGNKPVPMDRVDLSKETRDGTGMAELDRVLGGGIVRGSLVLVGGDPGIGKSTLLLQLAGSISQRQRTLYMSGEESVKQIKLRAERLGINSENIFLLGETDIDLILDQIKTFNPDMIIIDSIQTMYTSEISSAPGSVSQVREVTGRLLRTAKTMSIPIFIIGHVTKQGAIAGPRVLEHMVDTVLYFEGERYYSYRVIRSVKNRFGSTNEIGVFEMKDKGLVEVPNPSEFMLAGRPLGVPGTVVVCSMEGTRPMLIELQALVSISNLGMPRRMATGIDYNRLSMLMAVMEKRLGMQVQGQDAFVNVVGGLKIDEPAADLGIVTAVASSFRNVPVDKGTVVIGEVGLTGEVRAVNSIDRRVAEAAKLGFGHCIVPKDNLRQIEDAAARITGVGNLAEALDATLGD
ncbi:MAG: DNA repair protein RadA [Bacillota bacterium]|nr:DNA repair protein RadA [Bacillota bacterium]MDD3297755.1 DNA repair protein RadA [Bacillota bacterium]MDD3850090.1 DNA repair protein RadA [Bacillota bacterium]MDD4706672.1 DNA repair protein RadA [Bacillota bacterium]